MNLKFKKDIVFFDLETTGVNVAEDRIVQIGIIKYFADNTKPVYENCRLVNPCIPIPKEATEVHKITDDMVKNEPTFKQISKKLLELIGDADLGGYNSNNFDIPLIIEEFNRAGIDFDIRNRRLIDVMKLKQMMEPNTLEYNYKYYCGKQIEGAHDALVDIKATIEIFEAQLEKYKGVEYKDKEGNITKEPFKNIESIHELTSTKDAIDIMGKVIYNKEGIPVLNFGKYKDKPVLEALNGDSWYYKNYILDKSKSNFTSETINIIKLIMEGEIGKR